MFAPSSNVIDSSRRWSRHRPDCRVAIGQIGMLAGDADVIHGDLSLSSNLFVSPSPPDERVNDLAHGNTDLVRLGMSGDVWGRLGTPRDVWRRLVISGDTW